jgi:hypothetical protein
VVVGAHVLGIDLQPPFDGSPRAFQAASFPRRVAERLVLLERHDDVAIVVGREFEGPLVVDDGFRRRSFATRNLAQT